MYHLAAIRCCYFFFFFKKKKVFRDLVLSDLLFDLFQYIEFFFSLERKLNSSFFDFNQSPKKLLKKNDTFQVINNSFRDDALLEKKFSIKKKLNNVRFQKVPSEWEGKIHVIHTLNDSFFFKKNYQLFSQIKLMELSRILQLEKDDIKEYIFRRIPPYFLPKDTRKRMFFLIKKILKNSLKKFLNVSVSRGSFFREVMNFLNKFSWKDYGNSSRFLYRIQKKEALKRKGILTESNNQNFSIFSDFRDEVFSLFLFQMSNQELKKFLGFSRFEEDFWLKRVQVLYRRADFFLQSLMPFFSFSYIYNLISKGVIKGMSRRIVSYLPFQNFEILRFRFSLLEYIEKRNLLYFWSLFFYLNNFAFDSVVSTIKKKFYIEYIRIFSMFKKRKGTASKRLFWFISKNHSSERIILNKSLLHRLKKKYSKRFLKRKLTRIRKFQMSYMKDIARMVGFYSFFRNKVQMSYKINSYIGPFFQKPGPRLPKNKEKWKNQKINKELMRFFLRKNDVKEHDLDRVINLERKTFSDMYGLYKDRFYQGRLLYLYKSRDMGRKSVFFQYGDISKKELKSKLGIRREDVFQKKMKYPLFGNELMRLIRDREKDQNKHNYLNRYFFTGGKIPKVFHSILTLFFFGENKDLSYYFFFFFYFHLFSFGNYSLYQSHECRSYTHILLRKKMMKYHEKMRSGWIRALMPWVDL